MNQTDQINQTDERDQINEQIQKSRLDPKFSERLLTPHASHLTPHALRLTPHASRLTPHAREPNKPWGGEEQEKFKNQDLTPTRYFLPLP